VSERDALLAAALHHPDDDTPKLAFADWCDDNGDPKRAEFIREQVELDRQSDKFKGVTLEGGITVSRMDGNLTVGGFVRVGQLPAIQQMRAPDASAPGLATARAIPLRFNDYEAPLAVPIESLVSRDMRSGCVRVVFSLFPIIEGGKLVFYRNRTDPQWLLRSLFLDMKNYPLVYNAGR
jgi:uncharacterized protein (TIGR02996 family)